MENIALSHHMKIDNKASEKQISVYCLLYMSLIILERKEVYCLIL